MLGEVGNSQFILLELRLQSIAALFESRALGLCIGQHFLLTGLVLLEALFALAILALLGDLALLDPF